METDVIPAWRYTWKRLYILLTTISVPNYMFVSKSAQFTWNFELCRRTSQIKTTLYSIQ